ncbi:MAG: phage baseplate assembly protein domain-containing protein [Stellaceae bacterium]
MADGIDQIFGDIRGIVGWGIVRSVEDGGQAQTVSVQTADSAVRANVEVAQPFGLASNPPANGAIALVLAVGADPANLVALPAGCPSARFGAMEPGEAALYASDGSRVHVRQGGIIDVWGGSQVNVHSANMAITLAAGGVLTVTGDLHVTGEIIRGYGGGGQVVLGTHEHPQGTDSHGDTEQNTGAPIAGT